MWRRTKKDCLWFSLYYHYPNEEEAYEAKNQYFFGSELMVAPITEALDPVYHSASVSVWFPQTEFGMISSMIGSTKEKASLQSLELARIFRSLRVQEPSSLWMHNRRQGVELPEMLDWHLFPGDNRSFVLVEGEGASRLKPA